MAQTSATTCHLSAVYFHMKAYLFYWMQLNFPDIGLKLAEWVWKKEVRVRTVGLCSGFFLSMLLMRLLLQLQWTNFEDYYFRKTALVAMNCLPQRQCYMVMNCSCSSISSIFSVNIPLNSNKCRINKLRFPPRLTVSGNQIWSSSRVHKSSKKTYNGVEKLLGRGPMADLLILLISPCISWKEVSPLSHNYNN